MKLFPSTSSPSVTIQLHPETHITMASDLEQLLDMGFDKARAEIAVKKSGGRTLSRQTEADGQLNRWHA